MANISLLRECGEFCTERTHPKIPWLRSQAEAAIKATSNITFEREGVKILTPSFIDELLSELALRYSIKTVHKHVKFIPPLEPVFEAQIERGVRLRNTKKLAP